MVAFAQRRSHAAEAAGEGFPAGSIENIMHDDVTTKTSGGEEKKTTREQEEAYH